MWEIILLIIVVLYLLMGIRVIDQYEKAITFTLGKYTGTKEPGLRFVFIIIQRLERVDMRVRALDIEKQQVMTKDNVPVDVNGVIFFKVNKAEDAIIKVQHFEYAIAKHAQTALRDVCGSMTLDTVLTERQKIGDEIREIEPHTSLNAVCACFAIAYSKCCTLIIASSALLTLKNMTPFTSTGTLSLVMTCCFSISKALTLMSTLSNLCIIINTNLSPGSLVPVYFPKVNVIAFSYWSITLMPINKYRTTIINKIISHI